MNFSLGRIFFKINILEKEKFEDFVPCKSRIKDKSIEINFKPLSIVIFALFVCFFVSLCVCPLHFSIFVHY